MSEVKVRVLQSGSKDSSMFKDRESQVERLAKQIEKNNERMFEKSKEISEVLSRRMEETVTRQISEVTDKFNKQIAASKSKK